MASASRFCTTRPAFCRFKGGLVRLGAVAISGTLFSSRCLFDFRVGVGGGAVPVFTNVTCAMGQSSQRASVICTVRWLGRRLSVFFERQQGRTVAQRRNGLRAAHERE